MLDYQPSLPDTAKVLAEIHRTHHSHYISATVLGVPLVARTGELTTFIAGPEQQVAMVKTCITSIFKQN